MSLLNNLKKFLYGSPEMMMPGQGMGGGTQGFIGQGGEMGVGS